MTERSRPIPREEAGNVVRVEHVNVPRGPTSRPEAPRPRSEPPTTTTESPRTESPRVASEPPRVTSDAPRPTSDSPRVASSPPRPADAPRTEASRPQSSGGGLDQVLEPRQRAVTMVWGSGDTSVAKIAGLLAEANSAAGASAAPNRQEAPATERHVATRPAGPGSSAGSGGPAGPAVPQTPAPQASSAAPAVTVSHVVPLSGTAVVGRSDNPQFPAQASEAAYAGGGYQPVYSPSAYPPATPYPQYPGQQGSAYPPQGAPTGSSYPQGVQGSGYPTHAQPGGGYPHGSPGAQPYPNVQQAQAPSGYPGNPQASGYPHNVQHNVQGVSGYPQTGERQSVYPPPHPGSAYPQGGVSGAPGPGQTSQGAPGAAGAPGQGQAASSFALQTTTGQAAAGGAVLVPTPSVAPGGANYADRIDWQRLWLALQRSEWQSLGFVDPDPTASTLPLARALADVGHRHHGQTLSVMDVSDLSLDRLEARRAELLLRVRRNEIVLLALGNVLGNPPLLSLAESIDVMVLSAARGASLKEAERTVAALGAQRFVGSLLYKRGSNR